MNPNFCKFLIGQGTKESFKEQAQERPGKGRMVRDGPGRNSRERSEKGRV